MSTGVIGRFGRSLDSEFRGVPSAIASLTSVFCAGPDPKDPIIHTAPLLCIEVLSKDETLRELQERVNDYAAMGVEHIWAVDPWARVGYYGSQRGFVQPEDGVLRVEGTPIAVVLATVFAELDEN